MSEQPHIRVRLIPAPADQALFARPREQGTPLVWQSAFIPPWEDFLNLDNFIVLDLVGGAVEAVEILHLQNQRARSAAANDGGRTHKMFVDISNRQEVERGVTIAPRRVGSDLLCAIENAPPSERCLALGGGLAAMVAGDALSGLQVLGYYG